MNKPQISSQMKAGFAALIGWTNVGKSTLLNRLTGMNLAIVSRKPQTTRNRITGIVHGDGYQIAVIDTPGLHNPVKRISEIMIHTSWNAAESADAVVWVVLPDIDPGKQLSAVQSSMEKVRKPLIVAINKIDTVDRQQILPHIAFYNETLHPEAIVPVSALKNENLDRLVEVLVPLMPSSDPLFPDDMITDRTERFLISEMIRLHAIRLTHQEIPHSIAIEIEEYLDSQSGRPQRISAVIYVEKESQKGILIGKQGQKLKQIGSSARQDIGEFLGVETELFLWVKVRKDWRNDVAFMGRAGLLDE